jgi:hypothetical protein
MTQEMWNAKVDAMFAAHLRNALPVVPPAAHNVSVGRAYRRTERALTALAALDDAIGGTLPLPDAEGAMDGYADDLDAIRTKLLAAQTLLGAELDRIEDQESAQ